MRILIAGGGTAGHINPAIAVADTIRAHDKNAEIAFIGTSYGLENDLVAKAGYKIYRIEMRGLKRSISLSNVKTAYYYFSAPRKAKKLIKDFRPDVVFGTGGYLSWPLVKAAASLGVPSALHESNAIVGKAVRMLSGKVNRIYLNFPSAAEQIKESEKIMVVGNPLISGGAADRTPELIQKLGVANGAFTVLSFGGSLGSEKLSNIVIEVANSFKIKHPHVLFVHACGSKKYDSAVEHAASIGAVGAPNMRLEKYIYNMPEWQACADVVICRAGAMTISELAEAGKAAIIVPSPYVANNHQYENAKRLADAGAAIMIKERDITPEILSSTLEELILSETKRRALSENIKKFTHPDARERIYNDLCSLAKKSPFNTK